MTKDTPKQHSDRFNSAACYFADDRLQTAFAKSGISDLGYRSELYQEVNDVLFKWLAGHLEPQTALDMLSEWSVKHVTSIPPKPSERYFCHIVECEMLQNAQRAILRSCFSGAHHTAEGSSAIFGEPQDPAVG